ncbi:AarF/UbiB family protein [uncultured Bdellovibrio sp.]|uniref:AarF/UbiB family protein n=1 Tax=Bdellovibrio sp. HCB-162 TaxID=3394234 RepID=UPI0025D2E67B|nr:AarF/UbiB family protein [uncultured Bdellovibrio sp.]
MLRQLKFLLIGCVFVFKFAWAAAPATTGLYLSFEQRLALTYALMAQGEGEAQKEEILARAKNYFKGVYELEAKTVQVKNFNEFLTQFRGEWPNTQSVALDMELIEKAGPQALKTFVSDSPRVQRQIDEYIEWQTNQLKSSVGDQAPEKSQMELLGAKAMALLQNPDAQKIAEKWALNESDAILSDRMKELDRVGEKMAQSSFAQQQDATMRIFMQTMFSEYFSRLSPASKKLIVSSYLGGDLNLSDIKKFELMVQNSGPQLQKLLQVVARQADLSPEMLEVFRGLENSVRPVPWVQVDEILKHEKNNYKFTYFERKPLGVGTMAQVHRAKILVDGQRHDVVVRFIKPGISDRVEEDRKILTAVAEILDNNPEFRKTGAPKLGPVVEDITATVTAELSQEDTIQRQKLAKTRYEKTGFLKSPEYKNYIQFHVPEIYDSKGKSKFMVQEMVIGKKLDKEAATYSETIPTLKRSVVEEMSKVWAYEVLFGGGFYHSDLHQGNFMIRVTEPKIYVNILDYGMGGILSADLQRQVMVLGAGTELNNADLISRAFWKISNRSQNTVNETQFKTLVQERLKLIVSGKEKNASLEHWTAWAMDQGLKLPYEFISLNRGIVIVNKLLSDAGSNMSVTSLMKTFARSNPTLMYKRLVLEEKISHRDLIKLGWSELKVMMTGETVSSSIRCEMVFQ